MASEDDPFDTILSLEDGFYKEGYDLGTSNGERAGLIEGRWFGLEKGFDKYVLMGRMHGKAAIWSGRLLDADPKAEVGLLGNNHEEARIIPGSHLSPDMKSRLSQAQDGQAPRLPTTARLETHIRTLYALTEPDSLSTKNSEDSVSEFDDRLKRAEGKIKILDKLTGDLISEDSIGMSPSHIHDNLAINFTNEKGDGSIEDTSSLRRRH